MIDYTQFPSQEALGRKGVFYVGGHSTPGNKGQHWCDQMFVEAYIPKQITHPWPLILFHGAGQTNVNWLTTPDGRMGWADYFVSQGYAVFLAEQPARGRSAYHPDTDGTTMYHSLEALWTRFASAEGSWPQAHLHTQWPQVSEGMNGTVFTQFAQSQVEYLDSNKRSQELVLACAQELLEATGPAILLTHSQAGPFGWLIADSYPEYVKGIVALEPSGPPFSQNAEAEKAKNFGLADLPLHFVPPIEKAEDISLSKLSAFEEGLSDGLVFADPSPKLPNLSGIPIALIVSEASYHAGYDHITSHVLNQLGVLHDFIRLEEHGIFGNGHMMMLEKNNLEIAAMICQWLDNKNI